MAERPVLVLGTHNKKKGIELAELLAPHGLELRTLDDFPNAVEVEETGATFAENARLKATVQAQHLDAWVLGEDSGIAVDALDGRPGVWSARYAGPHATDRTNNDRLLEELHGVPAKRRTAHYVCHAALADPAGNLQTEREEICRGRILQEPHGTGGFGYDPLFEIVEYHRSFGQLGSAVKSVLSHRSRALRALLPEVVRLLSHPAFEMRSV